jgi:lysozyme
MNDLSLSTGGVDFIEAREGKRLKVYKDSAGRDTIGVGHLCTSHDPVEFWKENGITEAQCYGLLIQDTSHAVHAVNTLATVQLNQNQFDALVSFTFNLGSGALAHSTLLKYLNAGNFHDAASQFLVWDKQHVNGALVFSQGLLMRRQLEKTLFLTPLPPIV